MGSDRKARIRRLALDVLMELEEAGSDQLDTIVLMTHRCRSGDDVGEFLTDFAECLVGLLRDDFVSLSSSEPSESVHEDWGSRTLELLKAHVVWDNRARQWQPVKAGNRIPEVILTSRGAKFLSQIR